MARIRVFWGLYLGLMLFLELERPRHCSDGTLNPNLKRIHPKNHDLEQLLR